MKGFRVFRVLVVWLLGCWGLGFGVWCFGIWSRYFGLSLINGCGGCRLQGWGGDSLLWGLCG